jgi:hypothetical protein
VTIDLHEAISQAAEGARQLGTIAQSARRRVVELEAELEEARREIGRLRAGSDPEEPADPVTYLLWSGRHEAWWGPDQRGYTTQLENAGRYGRAEALDCVLRSAQCGVREQVTSMVAAPECFTFAVSPTPVVLAVDPGVQVEQAPTAAAALRAMADEIDRGPTFPVPPSVISALIRERADALEADRG